jgi:hypothetical protein
MLGRRDRVTALEGRRGIGDEEDEDGEGWRKFCRAGHDMGFDTAISTLS